jgi:AcrR family transcriptional regulator
MPHPHAVPDEYVAALRAYLTGDPGYDELSQRLADRDGNEGGNVYAALLGMTFLIAARRRFRTHTSADVIRFVARTRAAAGANGAAIDPGIAERTLRAALDQPSAATGIEDRIRAAAVMMLLPALLNQQATRSGELDTLLAEARELADRALAAQDHPPISQDGSG